MVMHAFIELQKSDNHTAQRSIDTIDWEVIFLRTQGNEIERTVHEQYNNGEVLATCQVVSDGHALYNGKYYTSTAVIMHSDELLVNVATVSQM
jgi:hypothetical protein